MRPWIGYRYPAFVLFAFEKDCIGARALSRMHPPIPAMLCIYRPVYPPIDPRSPGCDSLKTFRRKYRKRSRVAASNDVVAISDDIVFDVERERRERKKRGEEGTDSVRILDRSNGPYMLPLIEQQITGIVSRFYSENHGDTASNDTRSSGN